MSTMHADGMNRWTAMAGPATAAAMLLSLAACASDEPAKEPAAATPIAAQASYQADISDADNDGVAVAVSATET